jgi:hypothetical protein
MQQASELEIVTTRVANHQLCFQAVRRQHNVVGKLKVVIPERPGLLIVRY